MTNDARTSKDQLRAKSVDLFAQLRHQGHGYVADAFDNALAEIERLEQDNARFINSHEVLSLLLDTQRDRIKELEEANSQLMQDLLKGSIRIAEAEKRSAQPPNASQAWMVWYEDNVVTPEIFSGHGAERAAKRRYQQARDHWSCHLFMRVEDEQRLPPTKSACPYPAHAQPCDCQQWTEQVLSEIRAGEKEGDGYGHCPECRAVPGTCIHSADEKPAPVHLRDIDSGGCVSHCPACRASAETSVSYIPGAVCGRMDCARPVPVGNVFCTDHQ